jgi:N-acetylneuraminic acid mutarotase
LLLLPAANCKAQIARSDEQKSPGILSAIGGMNKNRAAHTSTLLDNGKVLIAGGFNGDENGTASTEIFDPATKTFSPNGNLSIARASHTATLLPGGKVLIAGGFNGNYLDSAEIYDPKTGKFTAAGKMTLPRSEHAAVLLKNGKVLLAGGVGTNWTFLADAEIYDPSTNSFSKTGNMTAARESHTATLLKDGQVLITGGHRGRRSAIEIYRSAEIYDPQKGGFTASADLTVKRHKHDAVLLADGRVLIVGGSDERDSRGAYTNVEIYDPKTKNFAGIGDMRLSRYKLQGTTILLKNGRVLIAGGANQAEIFDPAKNSFEIAPGKFETARLFSTATLLADGQVLIAGGYDNGNAVNSGAWIYRA